MDTISDISGRTDFIETTLKNCDTLLRLLYDVEDAKHVREDIDYSLHDINEVCQRYDTIANRLMKTEQNFERIRREKHELNKKIEELENKLGVIKDSKKIGMRNVALRVFKNKQPKDTIKISDTDKMLLINLIDNAI